MGMDPKSDAERRRGSAVTKVTLFAAAWIVAGASASTSGCGPAKAKGPEVVPAAESWCPTGFEAGPEDTCFAVPEAGKTKAPILVYLHGTLDPKVGDAVFEPVRNALAKGYAVVLPRGKRGLCSWNKDLADKICWPQSADDDDEMKAIVKTWENVLFQVEALLEGGPHKRYVLGHEIGGSFGAYLATHGLFNASAYGLVGAGQLAPTFRAGQLPVPIVLLGQEGEAGVTDLHKSFEAAGWAHARCNRAAPGPLVKDDVDAALRFFERERAGELTGAMKLAKEFPCDGPPKAKPKAEPKPEKAP